MGERICTERTSDQDDDLPASPAAEKIGGNEDLLREIFLRLPVRTLRTFKSVSKNWLSIISDPQFVRKHTLHNNSSSIIPTTFFFFDSLTESDELDYVSLESVPDKSSMAATVRVPSLSFLDEAASGANIKLLQSINGLLLCRFTSNSKHEYCVWNPTTKNSTPIPQPRI